jgi:mannose-1-phosphate guanylyltransferase
MIYWTLDLLKQFRVSEVILCVNYLADNLRKAVGNEYGGIGIRYSLEHLPLGTAGPIRLASTLAQLPTTFIAMNGDIITNIKLDEMLEKHETSGATVTDALCRVKDPSRFGAVEMGSESRILRFIEKPKKNAPSRLINAGVYLIDRSLLKMIPPNRKISLEREIFPNLAGRGKLTGFPISGYWFDIGNISDYRRANFELMLKTVGMSIVRQGRSMIASDSKLTAPSIIGLNSAIGHGAKLGPNVISGRNVRLGRRVKIMNSILFDDVEIGDESNINGAIVGSNSLIGERVRVATGAIVSPGVNVHDDIRVGRGAIIHPYLEITEDVRSFAQLM